VYVGLHSLLRQSDPMLTTPRELARRRRVLFTMLTALAFRYPPDQEPPAIPALHQWLGGWPGPLAHRGLAASEAER
jgi:hypothetical protein